VPTRIWSLNAVLQTAQAHATGGAVLTTFDLPLGVPESYLAAVKRTVAPPAPSTFLELLACTRAWPRFFEASGDAPDLPLVPPFFAVPAGRGGLTSYTDTAARLGVDLYRQIDRLTGAKSVFVKAGIPGSVGSAASSFWQELAPLVNAPRSFKIWPFEGELQAL